MNQALNQVLLEAAAKALKTNLSNLLPKTAVKKLDPDKNYETYDLTLGEFFIPGRTRREEPTEEQKMVLGLKAYIKSLQDENNRLRTLVKSEREKSHQRGVSEGQAKGVEEGVRKAKSDVQTAVTKVQNNLTSVLKDFSEKKDAVLNRSERKALEIILLAAEHVIRRECTTGPDIVLKVLKAALQEAAATDKITIRVNPREVEAINAERNFWLPINNQLTDVSVEEDGRVCCGGCLIESSAGSVDARIETQMEKMREIFLTCWEQGTGAVS